MSDLNVGLMFESIHTQTPHMNYVYAKQSITELISEQLIIKIKLM